MRQEETDMPNSETVKVWDKEEFLTYLREERSMAEVVGAYKHPLSAIQTQQKRPDRRFVVYDGSDKGYLVLTPWKTSDGPPAKEDI
jgi:hypothetical protein